MQRLSSVAALAFVLVSCTQSTASTTRSPQLGRQAEYGDPRARLGMDSPVVRARGGKKSSTSESIFNLVNNVAGAGILTLPAGMGAGTGLIPAIALTSFLGLVSAHTFERIGEAGELTGETSFKGIWTKTLGPNTAWIVDAAILFMCASATIIYAGIMGDILTSLMNLAGVPAHLNMRSVNIASLTAGVLLPLSLQRDLSGLAFTSLLGFAAVVYTVVFMVIRAFDGTYAPGGRWAKQLSASMQPNFEGMGLLTFNSKALVLVNNLGLAYIAHYNAPVFHRELEDCTRARFSGMVRSSFLTIASLYVVTMVAGFFTFGRSTASNILNSYHEADPLAVVGRIATGLSVLFGFPLAFVGLKESYTSLAPLMPSPMRLLATHHDVLVAVLVTTIAIVACIARDIGLLVGVSGATLGSMIVYIFPSLIWMSALKLMRPEDESVAKWVNGPLLPFGVFVGALGVYMSIMNAKSS